MIQALASTFAALTLVYLSLIAYLITYLRRTHAATWLQIGRPFQIPTNRFNFTEWLALFRAALLTGRFIFLSNQYSKLNDAHVTKLIWSIRIVLVGCFFFLAVVLKLSP
jgi:hypothetical protein